jgi:hypothetical protein
MPEHIQALRSVMHAMGGDMDDHANTSEGVRFPVAGTGNESIQWMGLGAGGEIGCDGLQQGQKLGYRALGSIQPGLKFSAGE